MRCARLLLPVLLVAGVVVAGPAAAAPGVPAAGPAPAGAPATAPAPTNVTVSGVVRDDAGQPVPGALVRGGRYTTPTTTTATDGSYRLVVTVSEDQLCADGTAAGGSEYGYGSTCTRLPSPARATATVDLTVAVRGIVTGRVVDAAGAPLRDVTLSISDAPSPTRTEVAVTAADGTYSIRSARPGDVAICATGTGEHGGGSPTGYLDACVEASATARTSTAAPDLVLSEIGGAVTGTVRDGRAGRGLAGVRVTAWDTQGGNNQVATTTRADGTYSLLGMVTQEYEICFDGAGATGGRGTGGYGNQCWKYKDMPDGWIIGESTPVAVRAGTTVTGIDGALPRWGAVAGRMTDPRGRPVAGLVVTVGAPNEFTGARATTDADGRYRVASLVPGEYAVCVHPGRPTSGTGYLDHCVGAPAGGDRDGAPVAVTVVGNATQTVDDVLVPAGRLSGTVVDSAGRPIKGAVLTVYAGDNVLSFPTTDKQGRWSADAGISSDDRRLVPGEYQVYVGGPPGSDYVSVAHPAGYNVNDQGYGTQSPVTVVGGRATTITDTLYRGATLRGRVHDAAGTGQDAFVTMGSALTGGDPGDGDVTTPYVYTAPDGTWTQKGLPPGTYTVCANAFGTSAVAPAGFLFHCPTGDVADGVATTVTLAEGGSATVDSTLNPAAGVAGTVTTASGRPLWWSEVTVWQGTTEVASEISLTTGGFTIGRLLPGSYTVCAVGGIDRSVPSTPGQTWATRCWGANTGAPGAAVAVTAGALRSGLDIALPPGAYVAGRVTGVDGQAVAGATVVLTAAGRRYPVVPDGASWHATVPAGTYSVCATAPGGLAGCHQQPGDGASTVRIRASQTTGDLDITLR